MDTLKDFLFIIPARGGSKGIPNKNIKNFGGKKLICYAIDLARQFVPDSQICVTTDSGEIKNVVLDYGLNVPFLRPSDLATDYSGTREVIIHALEFYAQSGFKYKTIVLLQPTSPFRQKDHLAQALELFRDGVEMVVSVKEPDSNPYYDLFEESDSGFLVQSKAGSFTRRQDCPKVYKYNGALYIMDAKSVLEKSLNKFERIVKFNMDEISSIDLDTPLDWLWAEFILENHFHKNT